MKHKSLNKEKHAVAGVIEALLLIALVAVILSTIQMYYVPEIMEQKESDHMDVVANQFSQLKSVIDSQSLMGVLGNNESIVYAPMSSPITLGSNNLPYFVSAKSSGQINIIDLEKANSKIVTDNLSNISEDFSDGIPLTYVKYRAYNAYFPKGSPWQEYYLEGGGIFLKQSQGGTVLVQPSISSKDYGDSAINITYILPLFESYAGKNYTGGIKDHYIRTNYAQNYTLVIPNINYTYIYTDNIDAWYQSLINDDSGLLWAEYRDNDISVNSYNTTDPPYIKISPLNKDINLHFKIIKIEIQTGHGIVYKSE